MLVGYLDADGAYKVAKGTLSSSGSLSFAAAYTVVASGSVGDSVSLTAWVHHACCQAAEILARPTNGNRRPHPPPAPATTLPPRPPPPPRPPHPRDLRPRHALARSGLHRRVQDAEQHAERRRRDRWHPKDGMARPLSAAAAGPFAAAALRDPRPRPAPEASERATAGPFATAGGKCDGR